ncbi:hypothetical protein NDU88_008624 [Pleurodeles waltl]|uniref:Uncharacterized protein n=1 Tax=Pleurodeles waltl TaxID=8319 RepID=A0AAV7QS94_PLEWA|nr:hypothetical protein NDU88_008624 [Pleurodeles waltl]
MSIGRRTRARHAAALLMPAPAQPLPAGVRGIARALRQYVTLVSPRSPGSRRGSRSCILLTGLLFIYDVRQKHPAAVCPSHANLAMRRR